VSEQVNRN